MGLLSCPQGGGRAGHIYANSLGEAGQPSPLQHFLLSAWSRLQPQRHSRAFGSRAGMYLMDLGLTPTSGDIVRCGGPVREDKTQMRAEVKRPWRSRIGRAWEPETERGWKGVQTRPPSDFWPGTQMGDGQGDSMDNSRGRACMGSLEHQRGAFLETGGEVGPCFKRIQRWDAGEGAPGNIPQMCRRDMGEACHGPVSSWFPSDREAPPTLLGQGGGNSEREDGRKGGDGVKWIPKEQTAVK